jgi:hypothetical protein
MTEAWLLSDELAIRKAAGNPNGRIPLELPSISRVEKEPNPKAVLKKALLDASEHKSPRRRQRFQRDLGRCVHLVADYTAEFSALRRLSAYKAFEGDLRRALAT